MTEKKRLSIAQLNAMLKYHPHQRQRAVHTAKKKHRFRVASNGRRWGKSQVGGHELTHEAFAARFRQADLEPKGRRAEFWIVGPEYSDAEKEFRVLYNDLVGLEAPMDHPGTYYSATGDSMHLSMYGGRFQVHAKSAKYPDTLVGEALEGVILAEAAKLKPTVWTKYIRPTLADYQGWAFMSSTPEGKNWFYDQWVRGQNAEDPNWWSIRSPSWDNDILFPLGRNDPEILDMEGDMSAEKFKQEIGAEFNEFVGRVFKDFDEELHVGTHRYNPRWPVYIATDYGFTNPNVALFIQVDVWDNVTIVGEYYQRGRTAEEFAEDLLADDYLRVMCNDARLLFPDPAGPSDSATLAQKLRVTPQADTGGQLNTRLDLIRRWLKPAPFELPDGHPEKLPKLTIDRSCVHTIREMGAYRYPESKDESLATPNEKPMKVDDHTPETMGRFFAGHFGKAIAGRSGNTRQRTARFRR